MSEFCKRRAFDFGRAPLPAIGSQPPKVYRAVDLAKPLGGEVAVHGVVALPLEEAFARPPTPLETTWWAAVRPLRSSPAP